MFGLTECTKGKTFVNSWIESNDYTNEHTLFFQFVKGGEILCKVFHDELEAINAQKALISSIPSYEKVDSIALKDGITCTKCGMIRLHWTDKQ